MTAEIINIGEYADYSHLDYHYEIESDDFYDTKVEKVYEVDGKEFKREYIDVCYVQVPSIHNMIFGSLQEKIELTMAMVEFGVDCLDLLDDDKHESFIIKKLDLIINVNDEEDIDFHKSNASKMHKHNEEMYEKNGREYITVSNYRDFLEESDYE